MNSMIFMTGYIYAFAAGFFGASFFMIVDLQASLKKSSLTELRDMWTIRMILLRCLFGIGASTILYFFFQTDLLVTGAWPDINAMDFVQAKELDYEGPFQHSSFKLPNKEMALMIVWSFLAGYSQRLVPSLLSRTADSVSE